jgi:glucose/arabinose dehydrogenase
MRNPLVTSNGPKGNVPLLAVVLALSCVACSSAMAAPRIALQTYVSGFSSPVGMEAVRDGSGRFFVVEQTGKIRIVKNGVLLSSPFLDLTSKIEFNDEEGLLGLTFHPSYAQNGRFFVDYTQRVAGQLQSVIAEYHVSTNDPNKADPTETRILVVDQPFDNHNGGQLGFGADGYLYISFGDGGSGGDPMGNGQNLNVLLGKILRIDINTGSPYAIPPDNPFVGNPNEKGEIWAYGLRNPWRFSFDRPTGRLFAGDVGQNMYEEVDIIQKGLNYGWNIMEGFHCYNAPTCNMTGLTLPILEYSHLEGNAIIGGFVYRGTQIAGLRGVYVFADYGTGKIWGSKPDLSGTWQRVGLLASGKVVSAFGQDLAGELYVLDYGTGTIFKVVQG